MTRVNRVGPLAVAAGDAPALDDRCDPGVRGPAAVTDSTRRAVGRSDHELLAENPFFQVVLGIEQQRDRALARFVDPDLDDVAHLV